MGKAESALVTDLKHCYVCCSNQVQIHHVFHGTSNRKNADRFGYIVPLCMEHHTGNTGVHFNADFDLFLKQQAQQHFESNYGSRDDFRQVFGKSYL